MTQTHLTSPNNSGSILPKREVRENVLIVEDDYDTAHMLTILLSDAGYGTRSVQSRDAATTILERYIYQVILMDYYMPGLSAEKFVASVRKYHPRAVIVMMTAGTEADQKRKEHELVYCLKKPFTAEEVLHLLDRIAH